MDILIYSITLGITWTSFWYRLLNNHPVLLEALVMVLLIKYGWG